MRPKPFRSEPFGENGKYVLDQTEGIVWHRCGTRVLYADTDRSGLVYHANYFRFFELGRASVMRDTACSYREIEADGHVYPIVELGMTYHAPLNYDDPLWIHTRPAKLERARLWYNYVITHGETGKVASKGFTCHCAINGAGKPVPISEKARLLWHLFPENG